MVADVIRSVFKRNSSSCSFDLFAFSRFSSFSSFCFCVLYALNTCFFSFNFFNCSYLGSCCIIFTHCSHEAFEGTLLSFKSSLKASMASFLSLNVFGSGVELRDSFFTGSLKTESFESSSASLKDWFPQTFLMGADEKLLS